MVSENKLEYLVGKSEEEAIDSLKKDKKNYRIKRRDKEQLVGDMLYDKDRLNLEIEAGMVVAVSVG